jgi:imidazolonepropionase-like amidohydrolase
MRQFSAGWVLALVLTGASVEAQEVVQAFVGARILTGAGPSFDPGTLLISKGRITAVGLSSEIVPPEGAQIIDVAGRVIIPGLVDTHSHVGVYSRPAVPANSDGNESTGPVQSLVRALDAVNPFDPGIRMATSGGITTANIMPGSGNVIGGQTLYVKLRGHSPEAMRIVTERTLGGLKMANGENPKRNYGSKGKAPVTRMKIAALQRAEFHKARDYRQTWDIYRKKLAAGQDVAPPATDLSLEPLVEVLEGRRTVHFHSHRADDILTVLRLKHEFGFDLVIQHGTESYKVADVLAREGVPVSMTVVDSPGGKAEVADFLEECGAWLDQAGVKVIVNTDDYITESRFFLRTAAITVRGGLSEEKALAAVTLHAAQALRLDDRIGSLEAGKDADFVVLSGPPFSIYTRVLETYVEGTRVFSLADAQDRLYQSGGFAIRQEELRPAARSLVDPVPTVAQPAPPDETVAPAESGPVVVLAGRIRTAAGPNVLDGGVLIENGKISYVGPRTGLAIPAGARVLVAREVTPGMIDAHSVVPLAGQYNIQADQDADENTDPNEADLRVLDAFNPREPLLAYLLSQGVTAVHACPGRANVIGGQTGVFRTVGESADAMTIRSPQAMLFSLGEAPKLTYPGARPGTRMGTAGLIRQALSEAAAYRRKREAAGPDEVVARDLKLEALSDVLSGKVAAVFCAQRADDILTAARLAGEFRLRGQVALGAEAWLVKDDLRTSGLSVIAHPTMQRVGDMETFNSYLGNSAELADGGVLVAIGSGVESYVPKTRVIRHEAAIAMAHGLGPDRALAAVTIDAARILGIDKEYGSLEAGKAADLVLYDGDPFEHSTHVIYVVVDGKVAFDRAVRQRIPFSERAAAGSPEPACCLAW